MKKCVSNNSDANEIQKISKRSRKIKMLVGANRDPDAKERIRNDFKRKEKLVTMRKEMQNRRRGKKPDEK